MLIYLVKRFFNFCLEFFFLRLVIKSVEYGGFFRLVMWWRDVGDVSVGMMGWCCGNVYKVEKEKVV